VPGGPVANSWASRNRALHQLTKGSVGVAGEKSVVSDDSNQPPAAGGLFVTNLVKN
jgi:hypothetical protein